MTPFELHHCETCGYDLPAFLWGAGEVPGTAGRHAVIVDGPMTVEHDQPADYFTRNVIRVRVSMTARAVWCRDIERSTDAGDRTDEGRDRGEPVDARGGGAPPGGTEGSAAGTGGG